MDRWLFSTAAMLYVPKLGQWVVINQFGQEIIVTKEREEAEILLNGIEKIWHNREHLERMRERRGR